MGMSPNKGTYKARNKRTILNQKEKDFMKKLFSFVIAIAMMCTIFNVVAFANDNMLTSVQEHNRTCENYFHTDEEKAEAEKREQYPKLKPIGTDVVYAEKLLSIDDINSFLKSGEASEIGETIEKFQGTGQLKKELMESFEESQNQLLNYVWDIINMFDNNQKQMYFTGKRVCSQYVMLDDSVLNEYFEVSPEYEKRVEDFFEVSGITRMVTYLYEEHDYPNYLRGYALYKGVVFCDIEQVSFSTEFKEWFAKKKGWYVLDEESGQYVLDVDRVTHSDLTDMIQKYNHECWIPEIR